MEIQTQPGNLIGNTLTMAYRNLLKTLHNPDRSMDVIIQPVMFMLLFGYLHRLGHLMDFCPFWPVS